MKKEGLELQQIEKLSFSPGSSVVLHTSITHKGCMNMENGINIEHQQVKQHQTLQGEATT
jgi:hypothetical protein